MGEGGADKTLVAQVQQGDKQAFDMLVLKYQHRLIKLVSRYIKDSGDAEDVTQEAFLKAYRALPKFRGESAFYTWLYRIAINTAKNHLVMMARRPAQREADSSENSDELESLQHDIATPDKLLQAEEIRLTILKVLEELPEDLRTAINFREVEGLSYEDIAVAMECPIGTVRSRIFRAREAIDKQLKPLLE